MTNQFEGFTETFDDKNITQVEGTQGGWILDNYGFKDFNKLDSFWILLISTCGIALLVYNALRPSRSKLEKVLSSPDSHMIVSRSTIGLRETLLPQEDIEEHDDLSTLHGRSTFDVQWYRTNTGDVQLSKGCRLVFRNLRYTVLTKKGKLELLKGVSGRAQPGEMCALMGASGAGKSTLLDVIAGRKTVGTIDGANSFII